MFFKKNSKNGKILKQIIKQIVKINLVLKICDMMCFNFIRLGICIDLL